MKEHKAMKVPPRERILAAAEELFYREGIRGVGVEAIAAKAETTKMALYRHFESKDALVAEWLRRVARRNEAILERLAAEHEGEPRAQLLGWARLIAERLSGDADRGCAFINSVAELPDREHPAWRVIEAHKRKQIHTVTRLCAEAGMAQPETVASELFFVIDGAQVCAQSMGTVNAGERLLRLVRELIGAPQKTDAPRRPGSI